MFIATSEQLPEWSSDDAALLKSFFESSTGKKTLEILSYSAPSLMDGSDVNATLVRSGRVGGYGEAITNLLALRNSRPPETTGAPETYPSLDDDSQWPTEPSQPTNP